jgi:hypothetical protein
MPDPMLGGAAPAAPMAPPMGGLSDPMAGPGMGAPAAPPPSGDRQEIIGPINSVAQIFYDMDVAKYIQNNLQVDSKKLSRKIWLDYGGKENGQADKSKIGDRTDTDLELSPEDAKKERDLTEKTKWKRLEKGKTIEDIISYDDLGKVVEGLIFGVIQKASASAAAPPGAAPMGGGLLASNKARIIIAKALEKEYEFFLTDTIIKDILKSI